MPVFDALYDHRKELNHILVRHEQGATHAAQGFARVSGEVGVCLVTSGPGATNTITGIADAMIDSTPIVVIAGQVGTNFLGTDAFQEVDLVGITQPITKWSYQIRRAEDVAWAVARAFYVAKSGRPGPVVLDFAKNAQVEKTEYAPTKVDYVRSYLPVPEMEPEAIRKAAELINGAKRPLVLVGQGVELGEAQQELRAFIEKAGMPAGCTLLGLSALPTNHPLNKGMLGMHGNLGPNINTNKCDVLIAVGMRFDDRVTGRLQDFASHARIVHIDIDPTSIRKNVEVDVPVVGDCRQALEGILEICRAKMADTDWSGMHADWLQTVHEWKANHPLAYNKNGHIKPQQVIETMYSITKGDAIIATEVGQNQMWAAQFYTFTKPRTLLTSGGLGTMGYGFPAAIGAQFAFPDKLVINVAGDGSIQMNIQELATVVQNKIPVKVVILNNGHLGMVRQWQELFYNRNYSHTNMEAQPDFVKLAEAYGAEGYRISKPEELEDVLRKALTSPNPAFIDVMVEREENVYPMVPAGAALDEMLLV